MSSAIRFVGNYDVMSDGKFLWEILAQLRRFGVGRIVTKNEWGRKWPDQPSYLRIVRAQPAMDRWLFGGKLWGEWTFRGQNLGVYEFDKDLNRSDWRLIHRHEETHFTKCQQPMKEIVLPDSFPIPPLQTLFMKKSMEKAGIEATPENRAPLSVCVDPQFEMISSFIKQSPPSKTSNSIYDEVDSKALLDLYGKDLPVKVEAWNVGPAGFKPRFSST